MRFDKFDNHARKEISNHETPLDTETLWGKVQVELHPKRKKKFSWVWFSASSFMLISLLSGYLYFNNSDAKNKQLSNTVIHESKATNKQTPAKNDDLAKKENAETVMQESITSQASINTKTNQKETVAKNTKSTTTQKNTPLEHLTNANAARPKRSSAYSTTNQSEKTDIEIQTVESKIYNHIVASEDKIEIKSNLTKNKYEKKEVEKESKESINKKTKIETTIIDENPSSIEVNKQIRSAETEENSIVNEAETKIETTIIDENASFIEVNEQIRSDETEENLIINKVETKINEEPIEVDQNEGTKEENNEDEEDKSKNNINKNFTVGVGFRTGIGNSITTLTPNAGSDESLRNLRRESETNLETIDLGIDLLVKHKSGIYISTGIDYIRSSRKLEYNIENTSVDSIMGISEIFVNPISNDTTFQEGVIARTTTNFRNKETFNNLHMLNIPIQIGASVNYNRWSFGIQGGALLNIALQHKGEILESENTFYDLKTDNNNWFKDNLGVSYQASVLFGYHFTDNFQILGGPSYRSQLNISSDINPVQQMQTGIGLQLAARYWW